MRVILIAVRMYTNVLLLPLSSLITRDIFIIRLDINAKHKDFNT